jgi:hypothetical protein
MTTMTSNSVPCVVDPGLPLDVCTALLADVGRALNRCVNNGLDVRAENGILHCLVKAPSWKDTDE